MRLRWSRGWGLGFRSRATPRNGSWLLRGRWGGGFSLRLQVFPLRGLCRWICFQLASRFRTTHHSKDEAEYKSSYPKPFHSSHFAMIPPFSFSLYLLWSSPSRIRRSGRGRRRCRSNGLRGRDGCRRLRRDTSRDRGSWGRLSAYGRSRFDLCSNIRSLLWRR